ncbi:hypothetical protein GCM10023187_48160 [Nibrella viscosa]|uniref:Uncharacterized protein n=1 Tax=Nibrella viscosa TaxID=1084524 RepID=A0ABP8KUN8_9BACT
MRNLLVLASAMVIAWVYGTAEEHNEEDFAQPKRKPNKSGKSGRNPKNTVEDWEPELQNSL